MKKLFEKLDAHLYISTILLAIIFLSAITVHATNPVVTNVTATQQLSTKLVSISYDVFDVSGAVQSVSIAISTNSGASFDLVATNFSGDVGYGIITGANKQIVWDAGADWNWNYSSNIRFKVTADSITPLNMAFIPAGSFQMGNTFGPNEGHLREKPVHDVYIDAFFMDKYEVSNEKMREVMQWAFDNGKIIASELSITNSEGDRQILYAYNSSYGPLTYGQLSFSNGTFLVDAGKSNYPCFNVSWYGAQAYCNYKSDMEGLERCISFDDWSCNWNSNGYRLPTEAEWEKAARGGTPGTRFPWSDSNIITFSNANYESLLPREDYDHAISVGYNPAFVTEREPYTNPEGYFAPNGYGLYDMGGNVQEWIYDLYASDWYSEPSATNANTHGPASTREGYRSMRDGSWDESSYYVRCSTRDHQLLNNSLPTLGFRCARRIKNSKQKH